MCTTQTGTFTATPRTIKAGSVSTLQWSINNPTNACSLTAVPVCTGTCNAARTAAAATLNTTLQTGTTDANDPNNINGELRTIQNAIQTEAFNNGVPGKALGKKSLRINYTTDFILDCGAGGSQKTRVQVTNETES